jgi:hypothetical protein
MKTPLLLFMSILVLLVFSSCSISQEDAEKQATLFYQALQEDNYSSIETMIDEEGLKVSPWEDWKAIMTQKVTLGKLISFEREDSYNTGYQNGLNYVDLYYIVKYEKVMLFEFFRMVKRGDDYRIITYSYYDNKERRADFVKSIN